MGFPIDAHVSANGEIILNEGHEFVFRFPETCSIRSQWKLLGTERVQLAINRKNRVMVAAAGYTFNVHLIPLKEFDSCRFQ